MSYLEELRQLVGHRPLITVGAGVLIVSHQNQLLMQHRTDNGLWGIPGGAMEPGETIEATARREVREETGLTLGQLSLFGIYSGPEMFYEYPNGDQVFNVSIIYISHELAGDLQGNHEAEELRFFDIEAIPSNLSPPIRPAIADFVRLYKQTA
ncbi:MAG: NUDIX hydrolase [Abitibacteriaceae bacterium]|nr:NUDIX hydrolase [Abditibacteriaceae bacterium]